MFDKVKVVLVEDDMDFAFLLRKIMEQDYKLEFLAHAANRTLGVEMVKMLKPDIVVMDLNLSGSDLDGIGAAKEIRLKTGIKVILLTSYEQPEIIINASKQAFASGYIFKSQCQQLTDTIYRTATSVTPQEHFIRELILQELTPAERSILNDLVEGNTGKPATSSQKTIANQKTNIFKKLGFRNAKEAVRVFKS